MKDVFVKSVNRRYLTDIEVLFSNKNRCDGEVKFKNTVYKAERSKGRITRFINCSLNVCLGFLNTERVEEMLFHFTIKIKRWVLTELRLWLDLFRTKSNLTMPLWPCQVSLRAATSVKLPQINSWVPVFFLKHWIFPVFMIFLRCCPAHQVSQGWRTNEVIIDKGTLKPQI